MYKDLLQRFSNYNCVTGKTICEQFNGIECRVQKHSHISVESSDYNKGTSTIQWKKDLCLMYNTKPIGCMYLWNWNIDLNVKVKQ